MHTFIFIYICIRIHILSHGVLLWQISGIRYVDRCACLSIYAYVYMYTFSDFRYVAVTACWYTVCGQMCVTVFRCIHVCVYCFGVLLWLLAGIRYVNRCASLSIYRCASLSIHVKQHQSNIH